MKQGGGETSRRKCYKEKEKTQTDGDVDIDIHELHSDTGTATVYMSDVKCENWLLVLNVSLRAVDW